jgi:hypothetical protein
MRLFIVPAGLRMRVQHHGDGRARAGTRMETALEPAFGPGK